MAITLGTFTDRSANRWLTDEILDDVQGIGFEGASKSPANVRLIIDD